MRMTLSAAKPAPLGTGSTAGSRPASVSAERATVVALSASTESVEAARWSLASAGAKSTVDGGARGHGADGEELVEASVRAAVAQPEHRAHGHARGVVERQLRVACGEIGLQDADKRRRRLQRHDIARRIVVGERSGEQESWGCSAATVTLSLRVPSAITRRSPAAIPAGLATSMLAAPAWAAALSVRAPAASPAASADSISVLSSAPAPTMRVMKTRLPPLVKKPSAA